MTELVLKASGLRKSFGRVDAVAGVDLVVERGSIHGIVGPNGAGKTSLLNLLSGYLRPDAGVVSLEGRDITHFSPQKRVPLGLVRTFQNIRLFGSLTVRQNIMIGQHAHARSGLKSLFPVVTARERRDLAEVDELMEMFDLTPYASRPATDLPYGIQKQLDMARSLAAHPQIVLLDEPAAGMPAANRGRLAGQILRIRDEGISVVVVEHDMDVITRICDTVTVLDFGQLLLTGKPESALSDSRVREAYLGH